MNIRFFVLALVAALFLAMNVAPTARPAAAQKAVPGELDMSSVRDPQCFPTGVIEVDVSTPNPTFVVTSTMALAVHYDLGLTGYWRSWYPVSKDFAVDGIYKARYEPEEVKVYPFPEGKGCVWGDIIPVARMLDFGFERDHNSELLPYGGLIIPVEATDQMPVSPHRLSSYNCEETIVAKVPNGALVREAMSGTLWEACVYTKLHTPLCEQGSHKGRLTNIEGVRQDMPNWPVIRTLDNCNEFAVLERKFNMTPLARRYGVVNLVVNMPFLDNN